LATCDSRSGVQSGLMNSRKTLRVKRLAAAIDITAAGTSAPIAMAANATPWNHGGKNFRNRSGTASLGLAGLIAAATVI